MKPTAAHGDGGVRSAEELPAKQRRLPAWLVLTLLTLVLLAVLALADSAYAC